MEPKRLRLAALSTALAVTSVGLLLLSWCPGGPGITPRRQNPISMDREEPISVRREILTQYDLIIERRARLSSGAVVRATYHFNRNSIVASCLSGNRLVALTSSRDLLSFDALTVRLERVRVGRESVACLGTGPAGEVVAGLDDGRIVQVDPVSLEFSPKGQLTGSPSWFASHPNSPLLVAESDRQTHVVSVVDLESSRRIPLDWVTLQGGSKMLGASALLLDGKNRLWLGGDMGEWGGWCGWLDLASGKLNVVSNDCDGVHGFVEISNGDVWTYGGLTHMGLVRRFIARVGEGKFERLHLDETKPPVTHIFQAPASETVWVVSHEGLFQTTRDLKRGTMMYKPQVRISWGRPDAVGSYPAITEIHPGDRMILATLNDGYVTLEGDRETHHSIRGQLEIADIERIVHTDVGVVFCPGDDRRPAWRIRSGLWEKLEIEPPFKAEYGPWSSQRILVEPDGAMVTITQDNSYPGTVAIMRWRSGQHTVLARQERVLLRVSDAFGTPDGGLWMVSDGKVYRFIDNLWMHVGVAAATMQGDPQTVVQAGPPWHVVDRRSHKLFRLSIEPTPRLDEVPLGEVKVHDALAWKEGSLLLATDQGLRLYRDGAMGPPDLPVTAAPPFRTARDGLGRLWMGGNGLWLVQGNELIHLDDAIEIGVSPVEAIAADPDHLGGVIVSIGGRGVLFVRLED
jgi:hypothetical protein